MKYTFVLCLVCSLTAIGCKNQSTEPQRQPSTLKVHQAEAAATHNPNAPPSVNSAMKLPAGHPPVGANSATAAQQAPNRRIVTGTVEDVVAAGKYIYLKLATSDGETWAAVPKASIKKGDTATVVNAAQMLEFKSKTLGRTFDKIWFGVLKGNAPEASNAGGKAPVAGETPALGGAAKSKAIAGGAPTGVIAIAEIYAQGAALGGKTVTVKGKVVKFNAQILGRNWLHIQDGSGDAGKGNHDITVTTDGTAAVGDVVTARGLVILNKDFGAGYKFQIMIEQASISR
jgi:hypothetical protein